MLTRDDKVDPRPRWLTALRPGAYVLACPRRGAPFGPIPEVQWWNEDDLQSLCLKIGDEWLEVWDSKSTTLRAHPIPANHVPLIDPVEVAALGQTPSPRSLPELRATRPKRSVENRRATVPPWSRLTRKRSPSPPQTKEEVDWGGSDQEA